MDKRRKKTYILGTAVLILVVFYSLLAYGRVRKFKEENPVITHEAGEAFETNGIQMQVKGFVRYDLSEFESRYGELDSGIYSEEYWENMHTKETSFYVVEFECWNPGSETVTYDFTWPEFGGKTWSVPVAYELLSHMDNEKNTMYVELAPGKRVVMQYPFFVLEGTYFPDGRRWEKFLQEENYVYFLAYDSTLHQVRLEEVS